MEFVNNPYNFFWVNCQYNLKDETRTAQPLPDEIFEFFITHTISARGVVSLLQKRYGRNLYFLTASNPLEQNMDKFLESFWHIPLDVDAYNSPKTLLDICSQRPDMMIRRLFIYTYNRLTATVDIEFMRPVFYQRMTDPILPVDAVAAARIMSITIENGVPKEAELMWDPIFFTQTFDDNEVKIRARYLSREDKRWAFDKSFAGKSDELPAKYHARSSKGSPHPSVPYDVRCLSVTEYIDRRVANALFKKSNVYSLFKRKHPDVRLGVIAVQWDLRGTYQVRPPCEFASFDLVDDTATGGTSTFTTKYLSCHEERNENFVTNVVETYDSVAQTITKRIEWYRPVFFTIRKDKNTCIVNLCRSLWVTFHPESIEKGELLDVEFLGDPDIVIPAANDIFPDGTLNHVEMATICRETLIRYNMTKEGWSRTIPFISPYKK